MEAIINFTKGMTLVFANLCLLLASIMVVSTSVSVIKMSIKEWRETE